MNPAVSAGAFRRRTRAVLQIGLALLAGAAAENVGAAAGAEAPESITVVSDDNYPPYIFRDAGGALRGILPDQWALWEQRTGIHVELLAMDWADAQRVMNEGRADVIDTLFRTPEREQIYDFTPPYALIEVPVYAHRDVAGIVDASSLQGFAIGVKSGDSVIGVLNNQGVDSLREYPSYEAIVRAARDEGLKVFSADEPAAMYYLYKYGIAGDFRKSFVLYTGAFHRAVAKGRTDLLEQILSGFDRIPPDEFRAIDDKWMGAPVEWPVRLRRFASLLGLVAAVFLLLAGGNLFLQRQVRRRTAELRDSRARLEHILRLAPVGICVVRGRTLIEANDTFCQGLGLARDEVIQHHTRLLYASDTDARRYELEFHRQIRRQGRVDTEIRTLRKNGQPLIVQVNGAPLDPERPAEGIIFTAMDITEARRTEKELRKSNAYFASVFDSINDALFIHDAATGELLDVNRRMLEMYGYGTREEVLAGDLSALCANIPPHSNAEAREWIRKALSEGPQVFEWKARRRNGQLFWTEVNIRRVSIDDRDRLVVTVRDISERKAAEEERLNYERRLQETQKLESLGLLAGGIAHDFNNLLTAILGNIDLALLDIPRDSNARSDLSTAITATRRAADLAQQMLAFSGKGHFIIEPLDLAAEIRSTVQMLKSSLPSNADLQIHLPDALPLIEGDASQIRQVLMNLVLNASEALENQPGSVRISAGTADGGDVSPGRMWPVDGLKPGPHIFVEVSDTGIGIRPELIDKIFDPFFSTKFTGRGLGLAAVIGIVRGHRGAIQVDSVLGQGTTFRVCIPASSIAPGRSGGAESAPLPEGTRSGFILLVDDEASLRETACKLLNRMGYQVLCASGGEQAIQLFQTRARQIKAVVLDLAMPRIDGVEVFDKLRRLRADIPVLIISGYAESEVFQRFHDPKPDGFLQKPFTFESLGSALDRICPGDARA